MVIVSISMLIIFIFSHWLLGDGTTDTRRTVVICVRWVFSILIFFDFYLPLVWRFAFWRLFSRFASGLYFMEIGGWVHKMFFRRFFFESLGFGECIRCFRRRMIERMLNIRVSSKFHVGCAWRRQFIMKAILIIN